MANADQQKLLLTIDANIELLRRTLNQGERDLVAFDRKASQSAASVEGAFGRMQAGGVAALGKLSAAIAAIGVVGLANIGRKVLQLADDLSTAADQANVSVERYQRLRGGLRALELDADKVDTVLKRLSDTLGAVQGGTAAAGVVAALDKMGVNSRILNGEITTTDGLLDAIAGSARNFKTEAEFTAAVVDVLGRKVGVDFAAAVRDGGIALAQAESQVTVATQSQIQALADANEAIDKFTENTQNSFILWAGNIITQVERVKRNIDILAANPGREDYLGGLLQVGRGYAKGGRGGGRAAIGTPERLSADAPSLAVVPPRRNAAPAAARRAAAARAGTPRGAALSPAQLREQGVGGPGVLEGVGPLVEDAQILRQTFLEIADFSNDIDASRLASSLEDAQRFARGVSENLAQAIVYGQDVGAALVNSLRAAAAEAVANGLFDLVLGKNGQGGLLGSFATSLAGAFGGGRALGGPVSAGRVYLAGERGPELIVPSVSSRVFTAAQTAGAGRSSPVFDLRGAVVTEDLLAQMQQLAARGAIAAVGISRSDMASQRRNRLPRSLG